VDCGGGGLGLGMDAFLYFAFLFFLLRYRLFPYSSLLFDDGNYQGILNRLRIDGGGGGLTPLCCSFCFGWNYEIAHGKKDGLNIGYEVVCLFVIHF
jgi:hypothetical protein